MNAYKVTFDSVTYAGGRTASPSSITTEARDAESAQESVIDMLEASGAVHGNIVSIQRVEAMPQSGIGPVAVTVGDEPPLKDFPITCFSDPDHKAKQAECIARLTRRF